MRISVSLLVLLLVVIYGCSADRYQPLHPSQDDSFVYQINPDSPLKIGVADSFPDGSASTGSGFLGLYSLNLDPESVAAELVPLRDPALTDVLEVVDITNFLTMAPCTDCAKLRSVSLNADNKLIVSIGVKHPFPAGDPLKPITGRNRADLHVFNVEGIIVSDCDSVPFPLSGKSIADFMLVNADGYTGYLDVSLDELFPTNASIHPYITFFDDYSSGNFDPLIPTGFLSVTDPGPSGNLVMPMGCDYNYQDYVFDIEDSINLILAVGCTYAVSAASKSMRFSPEYRVPQHNKKSASEIGFAIISNALKAADTTSTAEIQISVVDISHSVTVGSALNEMLADSSVNSIIVEIPGVMTSNLTIDGGSPVSGSGHSPSDPLLYEATITNDAGGDMGTYLGLIKVLDTYPSGLNESPLLSGCDGIKRVDPIVNPLTGVFQIDEFATYQVFQIEVAEGVTEPICDIHVSDTEVIVNTTILADPGTSNDPDGRIVQYEYDYDYDGVTFTTDASQTEMMPNFGTPVSILMCHSMPTVQIITVALRVTDNDSNKVICTEDITVNPSPKNVPIDDRPGRVVRDFGVREETNEGYVGFDDGQIWIYQPDYSSGVFKHQLRYNSVDYNLLFLDVTRRGDFYAVADNRRTVNFEKYDGSANFRLSLQSTYSFRDVAEVDYYYPGYFNWQNGGYAAVLGPGVSGDPTPRNMYSRHTWEQAGALTYFPPHNLPEEAAGKVSFWIVVAIEGGRNYDYFWCLEGAPRYEVERINGGGIFTGVTIGLNGGRADDITGFNDPKDITTDINDNVYILDLLSTGQPAVKKYRPDGTPVGMFGDSNSISGTPWRLDSNEVAGEIHVLHANGMSIFTSCEIPD